MLNGQDTVAFILSANIHRRHLTKGQAAMVVAKACPEKDQTDRRLAAITKISRNRINSARIILQYAPDLVDAVIAVSVSIDDAYQMALDRKAAANTTEKQLERLQAKAPDLADLVKEERLSPEEAFAAMLKLIFCLARL